MPGLGRSQLIPRLGLHDERLIAQLDDPSSVLLTSAPLAYMRFNPQLAFGSTIGRHTMLDPETHHRVLEPLERTDNFRRLPYGDEPQYRPDRDELDASAIRRLAEVVLNAQSNRRASLLVTPAHPAPGPGTLGRDQELLLAEAAVRIFRQQGMSEPPLTVDADYERLVYVTVTIDATVLRDPEVRTRLVDLYAGVDADGYFIQLLGFHERAEPSVAHAGSAFMFELIAASSRPLISGRPGNLVLPLLAAGLPAVELGIAEHERFNFSRRWEPSPDENPGRTLQIWHRDYFRSYRPNKAEPKHDKARRAFVEGSPCICGKHHPKRRPSGTQTKPHTFTCRLADAEEFGSGAVDERRRKLVDAIASAEELAEWARLDQVQRAAYEAVLDGASAAGGADEASGRPASS